MALELWIHQDRGDLGEPSLAFRSWVLRCKRVDIKSSIPSTSHPYQNLLKQHFLKTKEWVSCIIVLGLKNSHCSCRILVFQNLSWLDWLVFSSAVCMLLDVSFEVLLGCQALFWVMCLEARTDVSKHPSTSHWSTSCYAHDLGCEALPLTGSVTNHGMSEWRNYSA